MPHCNPIPGRWDLALDIWLNWCYTMIPSKSVQMTMLRGRQRSRACVKGTSDPWYPPKVILSPSSNTGYRMESDTSTHELFSFTAFDKRKNNYSFELTHHRRAGSRRNMNSDGHPWTPQILLVLTSSARLTAVPVFRAVSNVETTGLPDWHSTSHIDASRTYMWRLIAFRSTQKVQGQMKKEKCLGVRVTGNGVGYVRLS